MRNGKARRPITYPPGWVPNDPPAEFFLGRLPEREKVERIFQMHREGKTVEEIGKAIAIRDRYVKPNRELAERVIREGVARWDWVDDEVAIARAYGGDREVWKNLTHYERNAVMHLMAENSEENPHPLAVGLRRSANTNTAIADLYVDAETSGSTSVNGYVEWALAVGEEPLRIIRNLNKRRQRRAAAVRATAA